MKKLKVLTTLESAVEEEQDLDDQVWIETIFHPEVNLSKNQIRSQFKTWCNVTELPLCLQIDASEESDDYGPDSDGKCDSRNVLITSCWCSTYVHLSLRLFVSLSKQNYNFYWLFLEVSGEEVDKTVPKRKQRKTAESFTKSVKKSKVEFEQIKQQKHEKQQLKVKKRKEIKSTKFSHFFFILF